jgi:hypothetical protein
MPELFSILSAELSASIPAEPRATDTAGCKIQLLFVRNLDRFVFLPFETERQHFSQHRLGNVGPPPSKCSVGHLARFVDPLSLSLSLIELAAQPESGVFEQRLDERRVGVGLEIPKCLGAFGTQALICRLHPLLGLVFETIVDRKVHEKLRLGPRTPENMKA